MSKKNNNQNLIKGLDTFDFTYFDINLKNVIKDNIADDVINKIIINSIENLKNTIPRLFRKISFTLEKTNDNNILHWQMRGRTLKKWTENSIKKYFNDNKILDSTNISATATANKDNFNYCIKMDTSKYKDFTFLFEKNKFTKISDDNKKTDIDVFLPHKFDLNRIKELLKSQKKVIEIAINETNIHSTCWNDRTVNFIYNPLGGGGKSTLCGLLKFNQCFGLNIIKLPCINDYKIIMQDLYQQAAASGKRNNFIVIIDFPRSINKDRLYQLYGAIEEAKEGILYDPRYDRKEWAINCPSIWIFSNQPPDFDCLTENRWRFWEIDKDDDLCSLTADELIQKQQRWMLDEQIKKIKFNNKKHINLINMIKNDLDNNKITKSEALILCKFNKICAKNLEDPEIVTIIDPLNDPLDA